MTLHCEAVRDATAGQTAIDGKDPRPVCMSRGRVEPRSVLQSPHYSPRRHPGWQPSEPERLRVPPPHR
eukprot:5029243-Pleurochrysis_carterae.AAC.1